MDAVEYLRIVSKLLKKMSDCGLRLEDYKHIGMVEEYRKMRTSGDKVDYIVQVLARKYKLSESTVKRTVRRLSKKVI